MRHLLDKRSLQSMLFCMILLYMYAVSALPTDKEAPLTMNAGAADLNQTTHLGTYSGGITLDQGTTHLRAEKGRTLTNERHQVIEAIIEGSATEQAHFWSLLEIDQPILHAYADMIYFYPQKHFVKLEGHAKVIQGRHHVEAPRLDYDLQTHHVQSFPQVGQQTIITIQPEPKS